MELHIRRIRINPYEKIPFICIIGGKDKAYLEKSKTKTGFVILVR